MASRVKLRDRNVPTLALSPAEAADALGVSRDFFDDEILHEVRHIRRGRRRIIPVTELQRWLDEQANRWTE